MRPDQEPFSKRFIQLPGVDLPEPFRRRVLYEIYDSFERFHPNTIRLDRAEELVARIAGVSKGRTYAGAYLHDIIVREEGLPESTALNMTRDRWFEEYGLTCAANKFLDILDYLFRGWWEGSDDHAGYINGLFEEYGLPYRIVDNRVQPVERRLELEELGTLETGDVKTVPLPVTLSPSSPYGNRVLMRKLLRECAGYLWWLEKHMPKLVLEVLHETVDADKVKQMRLLSGPKNVTGSCISDFDAFTREWTAKGVEVEWRVLPDQRLGQIHDRYILTSGGSYNVPPVNSIFGKAQMAEISPSNVKPTEFEALWGESNDIRSAKSSSGLP